VTDAKPSKSAKKRQFHALQDVGERLIELTDEQLGQIDTDEDLSEQVRIAKKMSAHGALRRQKQLIGKLMRNIDSAPILSALELFGGTEQIQKAVFRDAERWRDRLVDEGNNAMTAFFEGRDQPSETLASLLAALTRATDADTRKHIRKKIFREIHQLLLSDVHHIPD